VKTPFKVAMSKENLGGGASTGPSKGLGSIVNIVVAVVVTVMVSYFLFIPKNSLNSFKAEVTQSVETQLAAVQGISGTVQNIQSNIAGFQGTLDSMRSRVNQIDTIQSDLNTLKADPLSKYPNLISRVAALETEVATLQIEKKEEEEEASSSGKIKWYLDISDWGAKNVDSYSSDLIFEVDTDPGRIKEGDLYEVGVIITNPDTAKDVTLEDFWMELTLRASGYAMLNESETYLDSDSSPYLDWDAEFTIREREGAEVCRKVTFLSEESRKDIRIDADDSICLDLVLELYYA